MDVLLSLLDANLKLHEHVTKTLEKATGRQQALRGKTLAFDEQAFVQAQLALRETETRELALLHHTALLAQSLKREEAARQKENQQAQTFQMQEAFEKQEKSIRKDHSSIVKNAEELINTFLAQHEALARAAALFQTFDPRLVLLQPQADAAILKIFAHAENSAQKLRELAIAETQGDRPRKLAAALEARRSKMRQQMTRLSNARRHYAAFVYQQLPQAQTEREQPYLPA